MFFCTYLNESFQGKGYGAKLLDFAESLAATAEIDCVSCRSDLFPLYAKRGYKEVCRVPAETYIPVEAMTRTDLEMVVMHKQSPTPNVLKNMTLMYVHFEIVILR